MTRTARATLPGPASGLISPCNRRSVRAAALPPPPPSPPPPAIVSTRPSPSLASSSAPPLRAAVSAATGLILRGTPASPSSLPSDGAGIPGGPPTLAAAIAADFERAYFVSGDITGPAYSPAARFVDPTITVSGLASWRANIAALRGWLVQPGIELEGGRVEVVEGGGGDPQASAGSAALPTLRAAAGGGGAAPAAGSVALPTLRAAWRLKTGVALPWRPLVDVRGVTTYELEAVEGGDGGDNGRLRVVVHTEAWRTPALVAVGQLLVPGGVRGSGG